MATISVQQEPTSITLEKQGFRFILFQEERFTYFGELKDGCLFFHVSPVKYWSPSTYKCMLEAMTICKEQALAQDYKYIWGFCPLRKIKFATMLGFTPLTVHTTDDGPYVLCKQKTGTL